MEQSVQFNTRFSVVVVAVIVYKIVVLPFFSRCIPSITITAKIKMDGRKRRTAMMTLLGLESAAYILEIENISYKIPRLHWCILSNTINGFSLFLVMLSGMQFVCAQAPYNMKGLLFGVGIALYGFGAVIQAGILQIFVEKYQHIASSTPLTPEMWFYIVQAVIALVSFISVACTSYKKIQKKGQDWQYQV